MNIAVSAALPSNMHNSKPTRRDVLCALERGAAHYECLVLQCIGFNDALYQALRAPEQQKGTKQASSRKRKSKSQSRNVEDGDARESKRQKCA